MTTFHDEHLTLDLIPIDQIEEGRGLASRGFRSVAHGRLDRTGTTSVTVSRPIVLTVAEANSDRDFVGWLRETLIDDANAHIDKIASP
jgi:hypothetical protein